MDSRSSCAMNPRGGTSRLISSRGRIIYYRLCSTIISIPDHLNYVKGTLAMANSGPNTNGSQFFVVLDNLTSKLPKNYTIFGIIEDGFEVLDEIGATPTTLQPGGGESSRPISDLIMQKVSIQELEE